MKPKTPQKLPKRLAQPGRPYMPRQPRRSIKLDRVNPADFGRFEPRFFCDDCSHYSSSTRTCTLGYRPQHTRAEQMALYNLTGQLAICRALEID